MSLDGVETIVPLQESSEFMSKLLEDGFKGIEQLAESMQRVAKVGSVP